MNDNYIEAQESIRSDEQNGDRERAYEKQDAQEEHFEKLSIIGKLDVIVKQTQDLQRACKELDDMSKLFRTDEEAFSEEYLENERQAKFALRKD